MFRTVGDRPPLWKSLLPAEVLRLPAGLARVDALPDDPAFFAPFARYFHPVIGRPSTPAIPRQATTSPSRTAIEHGREFRKLVKWRSGREGRISYLKRG
jgi:hypothetical protein